MALRLLPKYLSRLFTEMKYCERTYRSTSATFSTHIHWRGEKRRYPRRLLRISSQVVDDILAGRWRYPRRLLTISSQAVDDILADCWRYRHKWRPASSASWRHTTHAGKKRKETRGKPSSPSSFWGRYPIRTGVDGFADRWLSLSSNRPCHLLLLSCKRFLFPIATAKLSIFFYSHTISMQLFSSWKQKNRQTGGKRLVRMKKEGPTATKRGDNVYVLKMENADGHRQIGTMCRK